MSVGQETRRRDSTTTTTKEEENRRRTTTGFGRGRTSDGRFKGSTTTTTTNDDDKMACKYVSEECLVEHASREEFLGDLMVEVHVVHREEKKGEDDDEKKDARKSVDKNVFTHVDLAGHRKPNTPRNFTFQKMTWREMIRRIRKGEKLYMRHTNGPKKPANVLKDFIDPETKRNPFDTPTFRERCSPAG